MVSVDVVRDGRGAEEASLRAAPRLGAASADSSPSWGRPNYDLFSIVEGSGRALHMQSRGDSSSIAREITGTVNLKITPILEWSWMMVELPRGGDSRRAATDDQAGQLYVVWRRFPEMLRSRIIGYVWDTTAPAGTIVKSQSAGAVTYVVVRSGPADSGRWLTETRNVYDDYKQIYGEEPPEEIRLISLAIDSNDTRSTAEAYAGEIFFRGPE